MKVVSSIILAILANVALAASVWAQETAPQTVTLYSPLQYSHDQSRAFFDFQSGRLAIHGAPWDLAYGLLRAGDDFDFFQSAGAHSNRGLIRDLGELKWTDQFEIPVIEPLPKLKPGEQRQISVDTSGADGADGRSAKLGNTDDVFSRVPPPRNDFPVEPTTLPSPTIERAPDSRPKRDGKTKTSPVFIKAIVGHVYAIHVVNDTQDYYALFRVEAMTRGDNCTISWRLVPAPVAETVRKQE